MPKERPTDADADASDDDHDEMAHSDTANGERPEQPDSSEHSARERRRTGEHPVGDEQAAVNRAEESPA